VLAALINACRLTGRRLEDLTVAMIGAGAAGVAVAKILMGAGVTAIVACDRYGAINTSRGDYQDGSMNTPKTWLAEHTNSEGVQGSIEDVIAGRDLFVGLSGPGLITAESLKRMNPDPFVFAMANPDPEVRPEEAAPYVRVMATGRSDYPNQINNVLAFPGIFRGALDARATRITEGMKVAAADAIAGVIANDLHADAIVPSPLDPRVADAVASAVAEAARRDGVCRA
jgi:malate dehydrogenase (oxaloacetate-decarboxylating)